MGTHSSVQVIHVTCRLINISIKLSTMEIAISIIASLSMQWKNYTITSQFIIGIEILQL